MFYGLSLFGHPWTPSPGSDTLATGSSSLQRGGRLGELVHALGKQTPRLGSVTGFSILALKTHT